jgi:hypothetical protein
MAPGKTVVDAAGHPVLAPASVRWRTSGHALHDTKERPIREYEPFFSGQLRLRERRRVAVRRRHAESYDAAGRQMGRHFPNGTFSRIKIAFGGLRRPTQMTLSWNPLGEHCAKHCPTMLPSAERWNKQNNMPIPPASLS